MAELDNWIKIINKTGKTGWLSFYESSLKQPVSNTDYFLEIIELYGMWPVVEGILAASRRHVTGDPLNYVVSVAQSKWREAYVASDESSRYQRGIERSKQVTQQRNEELEEKLERAKRAASN